MALCDGKKRAGRRAINAKARFRLYGLNRGRWVSRIDGFLRGSGKDIKKALVINQKGISD
jgi:hypothetical protein